MASMLRSPLKLYMRLESKILKIIRCMHSFHEWGIVPVARTQKGALFFVLFLRPKPENPGAESAQRPSTFGSQTGERDRRAKAQSLIF